VNHLAFTVENITAELERLKEAGVKLVDEEPRVILNGTVKIAFFQGPNGEKLELVER
jgi:lactoylglutathione lyase